VVFAATELAAGRKSYGIGVWHLVNGRPVRAREYFEKATAPPAQQSGFGSVASYYELQRIKR